ncbi:MAG TPA: hypothetical protein VG248_03575 [Caulobacteraceae bacterium]|jgi:hypothetical protein|nr:hypothetical protein [Caulobacteraceae bacterium]
MARRPKLQGPTVLGRVMEGNTGRPIHSPRNLQRHLNRQARERRLEVAGKVAETLADALKRIFGKAA